MSHRALMKALEKKQELEQELRTTRHELGRYKELYGELPDGGDGENIMIRRGSNRPKVELDENAFRNITSNECSNGSGECPECGTVSAERFCPECGYCIKCGG